jgi:uncharacterized phosphosugar-binding protein
MTEGSRRWLEAARGIIERVAATQTGEIDRAADLFADAIANDALVHVFGSGHSRMNTEEMFPRIGSFPGFHPIAELAVSNHVGVVGPNGLRQALFLERVDGFGRVILQAIKLHRGDCFLVFSSTGINGVVIEVALYAKAMGLPVVAVTSIDHGRSTTSRHPSGLRLMDIADIVIDNCSPAGDAVVELPGLRYRVGPSSSIGAISVVNALKVATAEKLIERQATPVVLTSPHFAGSVEGEEQLERVYEEYFRRVRRAYDPEGALEVPETYRSVLDALGQAGDPMLRPEPDSARP